MPKYHKLDNIIEFPAPPAEKLTIEQKEYWLGYIAAQETLRDGYLLIAEQHDRNKEYALRMLGKLDIELGLQET